MRAALKDSKVLIAGTARNCEKSLYSDIKIINDAFKEASLVSWLIIESDSTDSTIEVLNSLEKEFSLRFISLGCLRNKLPNRTERLAECRNYYLNELNNNSLYSDYDYLVVVDLDGINAQLTSKAVMECWKLKEDWDVCFSNQLGPYYDIWALRHETWSPNDCMANRKFLIEMGLKPYEADYIAVYSRMIKLNKLQKPIEVMSAFGGLGIYKIDILKGSTYSGIDKYGNEICEHVSFHAELKRKGAKLFIVPALINSSWNDHNEKIRIYQRIKVKLLYKIFGYLKSKRLTP